MGLKERKLVEQIKEETSKTNSELNKSLGFDIVLETDTESFPVDEAVLKDFFMHKIYGLDSIQKALEIIAEDKMGKEALQEQIKKVKLINTAESFTDAGRKEVKLVNGELFIFCAFNNNSDNLYKPEPLAKAIEGILE